MAAARLNHPNTAGGFGKMQFLARRRMLALALAVLVAGAAAAGFVRATESGVIVAANAPRASSGMTLFVVQQPGLLDRLSDPRAEYAIYYGNDVVYPLGGKGATIPFDGRTGSVFVPYNLFVVGNGDYDVVIRTGDDEYRTRVGVQKWVNHVWLHPFDTGNHVRVEVALGSATGGNPSDRILAEGELLVEMRYRGLDGKEDRSLTTFRAKTQHDQTSTSIDVPRSAFSAGPGYYSFEPLFHNGEAKNNLQVKADPTMANRNPPWNWMYFTR